MNPTSPNNPREQLEVRIVALLLGEASAFEAAELEAALAQDKELAAFHDEMKRTIGLVQDTSTQFKPVPAPVENPPKLSPERREKLLQTFKVIAPPELARPRARGFGWPSVARIAAILVIVGLAVAAIIPTFVKARRLAAPAAIAGFMEGEGITELAKETRSKSTLPFKSDGPAPPSKGDLRETRLGTKYNMNMTGASARNKEAKLNWGERDDVATDTEAKSAGAPSPVATTALGIVPPPAPSLPAGGVVAVEGFALAEAPRPVRQAIVLPGQTSDTDGDHLSLGRGVDVAGRSVAPAGQSYFGTAQRGEATATLNAGTLFVANGTAEIPPALGYRDGEKPAVSTPLAFDGGVETRRDLVRGFFDDSEGASSWERRFDSESRRQPASTAGLAGGVASQGQRPALAGVSDKRDRFYKAQDFDADYIVPATPAAAILANSLAASGVSVAPGLTVTPPPANQPVSGPATAPAKAPLPIKLPAPSLKGTPSDLPKGDRSEPVSQTLWSDTGRQAGQYYAYGLQPTQPATTDESVRLQVTAASTATPESKAKVAAGDTLTANFQSSGGLGAFGGGAWGGQVGGGGGRGGYANGAEAQQFAHGAVPASGGEQGLDFASGQVQNPTRKAAEAPARPVALFDHADGTVADPQVATVAGRFSTVTDIPIKYAAAMDISGPLGELANDQKGFKKSGAKSAPAATPPAEPAFAEKLERSKESTVRFGRRSESNGRLDVNGPSPDDGLFIDRVNVTGGSGSGSVAPGAQARTTWAWDVEKHRESLDALALLGDVDEEAQKGAANLRFGKQAKADDFAEGRKSNRERVDAAKDWYSLGNTKAEPESRTRQLEEQIAKQEESVRGRSTFARRLENRVASGKRSSGAVPTDEFAREETLKEAELELVRAENKPVETKRLAAIALPGVALEDGRSAREISDLSSRPDASYRLKIKAEADAKASQAQVVTGPAPAPSKPEVPAIQAVTGTSLASGLAVPGGTPVVVSEVQYQAPVMATNAVVGFATVPIARTNGSVGKVQVTRELASKSVEGDKPAPRPSTPPPTPQPEILTHENNFSTFSLNVSDVSFKLAEASLQNGALPDPGSVRVEEFLNAFHYRDPAPAPGARIGFAWERARYPFAHNRDILRLGVQTAARGREAQKPLNLVIALDNSGSMERPDRVAIVRQALQVLAAQLRPQDRISVISFSRTPRLWVDGMAGGNPQAFLRQVLDLNPEGGTNLEDAMNQAYATATKHFMPQGVNRVIFLTDGAANLGNVEPEELKKTVVAQRQRGIALDCFGIGWEGYDDDLLETLSRNGDGRYGFLNSPEDAAPEFADQLAGALNVSASDVKTQVEFNPQRVTSWRQIGYAKHQLKKEQFRDNTVDAAEIAAAEQGNALYVIETNPNGAGPIGVVRVRFKVPETGQYVEQEWPLAYVPRVPALEQSSPAMRLAVTASAFGEWLSTSPFAAEVRLPVLQAMLAGVPQTFAPDPRPQRLSTMIQQARTIAGK